MREQMDMRELPFDEFPDFRKGTVDVNPFQEYALTGLLLRDKEGRSLLERVESKVQLEVDRIMASYDIKLWREKTGLGLAEAKHQVEQIQRDLGL